MTIGWVIWGFLALEVFLRAALEIAEIRKSGQKNDRFALVRIIPLLNDLLPPESLSSKPQAPESAFAKAHERAHQKFHHGIIRQFFWAGILIAIAVFLGSVGILFQLGLVELLLLFHLLFAASRILFHFVCFSQEYEADTFAAKCVSKKVVIRAMNTLIAEEFPRSPLFAYVYRTHPTAVMRKKYLTKRQMPKSF